MKYTAQNIARELTRRGIPVAKLSKRERITGVKVSKFTNKVIFEWNDWERTVDRIDGQKVVIEALRDMSLKATEYNNTGLFIIHS